jgi:biopolymer transport protein ExbB
MMRFAITITLVSACGFRPAPAVIGDDDGGSGSDVMDAAVPDGNDALEANGRRKAITFVKPASNQNDFPAWIDLTDADIAGRALADGHDIYFTASDGTTRLDHELTSWNPTSHRLGAWVRIPTLDSANPTSIYVHYGDPGAAPPPNPKGVFKSSFVAVWHLDDELPATRIVDATTTSQGTPTLTAATTRVTGKLGSGLAFTDSNDMITFANPLSGTTPHTISVWVNQTANITHTAAIIAMGNSSGGQSRWLHGHFTNNSFAVGYYGPDINPSPAQVIDGANWTRLDWVYEGSNSKNHLFRNGVEIPGSPITTTGTINTPNNTTGYIGFAPEPSYGPNNGYEGTIDELRIATVARSTNWIATEYANQNSPSTFYGVGAEEMEP